MKRFTIALIIALGALSVKAQTQPQQHKKPVMILLPDSSNLIQLQNIILQSYQWMPQSGAPAGLVGQKGTPQTAGTGILGTIEQLYPLLVPMKKDSTVKVKPTVAKK